MVVGTLAVEKEYVGRDSATELIIVLLPTHERHLLLQPLSLASVLSIKYLKSLVLLLEEKTCVPK